MCISVWPDENFGFHELTEFKNLTGMIWVMFHFLKHLKVSFAISVRDTESTGCVICFYVTNPEMYSLASLRRLSIFWQEFSPANFSQNLVWVKVNFSSHSDAFLFWCALFHLYSVSRKGRITDMHWKCPHKAVKNCIFKTSIKYMVYAVNCKEYILSYPHAQLSVFPKKGSNEKHCASTLKYKRIH